MANEGVGAGFIGVQLQTGAFYEKLRVQELFKLFGAFYPRPLDRERCSGVSVAKFDVRLQRPVWPADHWPTWGYPLRRSRIVPSQPLMRPLSPQTGHSRAMVAPSGSNRCPTP